MLELKNILDDKYQQKFDTARVIGIDIGSRGAKGVLLYDGKIYLKIWQAVCQALKQEDSFFEIWWRRQEYQTLI